MGEKRVRGISESAVGPSICLEFTNTNGPGRLGGTPDKFASFSDLITWLEANGALEATGIRKLKRVAREDEALASRLFSRAVRLREALFRVVAGEVKGERPATKDVDLLSHEACAAMKSLRLARTDDGYGWQVCCPDDPAETYYLAAVVLSATKLLTSPDLDRVRICASPTCGWLFLDNSKNQTRKWCDMSDCGNRAKARRHYARVKAAKKRPARNTVRSS